jgi:hypothetical protein
VWPTPQSRVLRLGNADRGTQKAAVRLGRGTPDDRRGGNRGSGIPWGYFPPAPDPERSFRTYTESPQAVAARAAYVVHPFCPDASVTHAFASPASFTATIGVYAMASPDAVMLSVSLAVPALT